MKTARRSLWKTDAIVVALCAVLLMSSFAAVGPQGRRRAREAVCLSNLRQWHGVFLDYLQENDGQFFTGLPGTPGYWWPAQLDEATQSWKKNRIWFCPTNTGPLVDEDGHHAPSFTTFNAWGIYDFPKLGPDGIAGSYSLNGYTIALSDSPFGNSAYERGVPSGDGWRHLPSVPHGETVPLFLDALRFDVWPLAADAPPASESGAWAGNHMTRCCIDRHDGAVNCLFLDGAARKVGLKELWTLKWHRSFNTEGPWTTAGGALASDWPKWMRDLKDY